MNHPIVCKNIRELIRPLFEQSLVIDWIDDYIFTSQWRRPEDKIDFDSLSEITVYVHEGTIDYKNLDALAEEFGFYYELVNVDKKDQIILGREIKITFNK